MKPWQKQPIEKDQDTLELMVSGNAAFRITPAAGDIYDDPRADSGNDIGWFMMGSRNFSGFESDGEKSLDALLDLVAKKEKEAGIPPEKSRLAECLPDGSENPGWIDIDAVRKGYSQNLALAMSELDIMSAPIFAHCHSGCAFSVGRQAAWDDWDTVIAGFVWSDEFDNREDFMKHAEGCVRLYEKWANGEIYDIERADFNPRTGEIGEWEAVCTVYGYSDALDALKEEAAAEEPEKPKTAPKP